MTIKQVAKRARVSIATVSRTLHNRSSVSPETAERVRRAIKHFYYHPDANAQTLVSGRSRILGLVVSDITNPFFPELIRGFQDVALENGYDVLIAATNYESARMAHSVGRMIERNTHAPPLTTPPLHPPLTNHPA